MPLPHRLVIRHGGTLIVALLLSSAAWAQSAPPPDPAASIAPTPSVPYVAAPPASPDAAPADFETSDPAGSSPSAGASTPTAPGSFLFSSLQREPDEFTLINDKHRVSFHKPMFLLPVTYSNRYKRDESEFVFDISLKLRLFSSNLFFAYTQRSFWQIYNASESRPFRETDYNPELFYRWKPHFDLCPNCGFDIGGEHESNGQDVAESRSWNRLYFTAYKEWDRTLLYLKTWYRIPESRKKSPDDASGDDNPDISRYYGYGEIRLQQELFASKHLAALMVRGNPATHKGAVEFNYSVPFGDYLYWNVYVFNGYGDSLIDYNRSVTRIGVGVMLAR
ncbi:phospholipase A [Solimonas terrae]|uniref:Phospholipase A1 n=1 Tax=Solimonas terrae TaxID=1396819 RepID=A0A6M2BUJ1_9GAMM|nr:phospholipase A [Solimonas terrae]NGY06044.1 phospholipase A [Solimonas terrae]